MKTLFTALLAASALLPATAHAQRGGLNVDANMQARGERPDRGNRGDRAEARQQADVGVRADAQIDRPARQQDRQEARRERRDDRQDLDRDLRDNRQDFNRDRRGDNQALRNGNVTQQQFRAERRDDRRDLRNDQRDTRQDFRADRRDDRADNHADNRRDGQIDRRDAANGRAGWQNYSAFRNDNRGYQNQRYNNRGIGNRGIWNRDWRGDNRYDWNRYRTSNRGAYRLPRYYAPSGWSFGYRRFSVGVTLSSFLWDQNYWIDDPYSYRLPEAYGPYRWVRYYNDALLVDIRTGRVVDNVYGIFY